MFWFLSHESVQGFLSYVFVQIFHKENSKKLCETESPEEMASKEEIIAKTNAAREARKLARDRESAAIRLQRSIRGW